jgi:preprotein translocase subunit SecB
MKAKQSPLKLKDFTVFRSHVDFVFTDDPKLVHLYNLPVNIDFDVFQPEQNEKPIRFVEMTLSVNKTGKLPGYKIDCRVSGVFELEENEKIPNEIVHNLLGISTINLLISNLRGYLRNITSYGAYGPYLLPSLDINELLNTKLEKTKSIKSKDIQRKS